MGDRVPEDTVGGVAEEAAKLVGALRDWGGNRGGDRSGAAAAVGFSAATQHPGDDQSCRYCPMCRAIDVLRGTPDEVRLHLAAAATSLLQALTAALATPVPQPEDRGGTGTAVPGGGGVDQRRGG